MKNIFISVILQALWFSAAYSQSLPGIGLDSIPSDTDSICSIPVYTGNFDNTGYQKNDTVPDFTLYDINGTAVNLKAALQTGVPVLLISSSLTCPVYRGKIPVINQMASIYGNQLQIFIVYTVEAHPIVDISPYSGTVWVTSANQNENILFRQPVTYGERKAMVDTMLSLYTLNVPVLIDGPCNNWWVNYGPAPNNAYLIDTNGVVVAKHPWFHKPPLNMFCAVDSLLGTNSGQCSTFGNNGMFSFALATDSMEYGLPGQTLAIHATITNTNANQNVVMDIIKRQINIPSGWGTALCADICYAPTDDSIRITIPPATVQPFIFYFYTDLTPAQGMVRVLFRNAYNNQNRYFQGFYGFTNATAITESEWHSGVYVYPNPATDELLIEGFENFSEYVLSDNTGRRIASGKPTGIISLKHLTAGIYYLHLAGKDETVYKKVVKGR